GAEALSWPDGGATPFGGEKNTNWGGGYRVPALARWPGLVPARTEINDLFSAEDWATTLVAAAGEPDIRNQLLSGYSFWRQRLQGAPRRSQGAKQAMRVFLLERRR